MGGVRSMGNRQADGLRLLQTDKVSFLNRRWAAITRILRSPATSGVVIRDIVNLLRDEGLSLAISFRKSDGNGTTDIAVFRPATGTWFVKDDFSQTVGIGGNVPVPIDRDGDRHTDLGGPRPCDRDRRSARPAPLAATPR
jgi:hypothetical protein